MNPPNNQSGTGGRSRVPEWLKNLGIVVLALVLLGIFAWRPKALVGYFAAKATAAAIVVIGAVVASRRSQK